MKLALSLLLVTLALCCSDANAKTCPALQNEARAFVLDIKPLFYRVLKSFPAPIPAYESTMAVKDCVNRMPFNDRHKIYELMEAIGKTCNK
ncbi:secretoglobin family 1D member 2 isoform X3 [Myotis lucifugus]|uniref:secretoglobin family 1D member 2 isoform X3 n=1 Tax=Myotis lucifugus TaxID=59463 RepID=UPI0006D73755|nr:secretoglobin family 1D member 2 isoform X3 [Myotis lucifugus]